MSRYGLRQLRKEKTQKDGLTDRQTDTEWINIFFENFRVHFPSLWGTLNKAQVDIQVVVWNWRSTSEPLLCNSMEQMKRPNAHALEGNHFSALGGATGPLHTSQSFEGTVTKTFSNGSLSHWDQLHKVNQTWLTHLLEDKLTSWQNMFICFSRRAQMVYKRWGFQCRSGYYTTKHE